MAELLNYPFVNQLNSPTLDGRPDENKWFNCVICSILSAMLYWKPELRGKITPDSMKDAVLGEGYADKGTDAAWFVPFVAKYGLLLRPIQGTPGHLVELGHQLIQQGLPVIFTEIDVYVDTSLAQYAGWTHVGTWYKEIPGGLDAMDPFGGKLVSLADSQWATRLVGNTLWTVAKEVAEMPVTIDIHHPEIAKHFKELNPHQWQCTDAGPWQGRIIQYAMLSNYKTEGNAGLCGYDLLGRPMSNELTVGPEDVVQFYEYGVRRWKNGVVRPCALYDGGVGTDPMIAQQAAKAQAAYQALQAQVQALQAQAQAAPPPPAPPAIPPALIADVQQVGAAVATIVAKAETGTY